MGTEGWMRCIYFSVPFLTQSSTSVYCREIACLQLLCCAPSGILLQLTVGSAVHRKVKHPCIPHLGKKTQDQTVYADRLTMHTLPEHTYTNAFSPTQGVKHFEAQ